MDASGVVTGVAPGKADIILKADGKTLKLPVTVKKLEAASLSIVPPAKDVYVYDYVTLAVQTEPRRRHGEDHFLDQAATKRFATITKNGLVPRVARRADRDHRQDQALPEGAVCVDGQEDPGDPDSDYRPRL